MPPPAPRVRAGSREREPVPAGEHLQLEQLSGRRDRLAFETPAERDRLAVDDVVPVHTEAAGCANPEIDHAGMTLDRRRSGIPEPKEPARSRQSAEPEPSGLVRSHCRRRTPTRSRELQLFGDLDVARDKRVSAWGGEAARSYTQKLWMRLKMKAAYLPGC